MRFNNTLTTDTRRLLALTLAGLLAVAGASIAWASTTTLCPQSDHVAQVTATPVQIQFPTATETPGPPTETPTRTPTSLGRALVEAISPETNVRAGPDINAARLGQIYPGTSYPVIGRRFDWYQVEFPTSPNGTAWVYKDVVTLTGDANLIPEIEFEAIPTIDPAYLDAQQAATNAQATLFFITTTPGAIASLTAQAWITPTGVFTADPGDAGATLEPGAPLPTFTLPPFTNTPVIIPKAATPNSGNSTGGGLPPIVPILALASLGLMGLLVSFLRRL